MAETADIGTWKLNPAKTQVNTGGGPKSGILKVEPAGTGRKLTLDAVGPEGQSLHTEYTTNYDGKDDPVTGDAPFGSTVTATRVDANTIRSVIKRDGQVTVTQTSVISSDGKTRTVTVKGADATGQAVDFVSIWEKQ
jgi:hypothetical protein